MLTEPFEAVCLPVGEASSEPCTQYRPAAQSSQPPCETLQNLTETQRPYNTLRNPLSKSFNLQTLARPGCNLPTSPPFLPSAPHNLCIMRARQSDKPNCPPSNPAGPGLMGGRGGWKEEPTCFRLFSCIASCLRCCPPMSARRCEALGYGFRRLRSGTIRGHVE